LLLGGSGCIKQGWQGWELGTAYQERSSYMTEIAVPYRLTLTEVRTVSGEGHLNGKNPPPKEASTRVFAHQFY
jgi:hypothetical protein